MALGCARLTYMPSVEQQLVRGPGPGALRQQALQRDFDLLRIVRVDQAQPLRDPCHTGRAAAGPGRHERYGEDRSRVAAPVAEGHLDQDLAPVSAPRPSI